MVDAKDRGDREGVLISIETSSLSKGKVGVFLEEYDERLHYLEAIGWILIRIMKGFQAVTVASLFRPGREFVLA